MNHIVIFVLIIMGLYQSKLFLETNDIQSVKLCARKLHEIDKTLRALGSSSSFNLIYKRTKCGLSLILFLVLVLFAAAIVEMIVMDQPYYKSPFIYCCIIEYLYNFMIEFLLVTEFLTIVRCVKSEFQRANDLLSDVNILPITSISSELLKRSIFVNSNNSLNHTLTLRTTQLELQLASNKINRSRQLLRTIRQVHLELCRISKCFSMMYGIQISLEMVMCILSTTYYLYNFYVSYMNGVRDIYYMIFLIISTIFNCLPYFIRIFIVNVICHKTTEEAERTNEILHTFYGNNDDYEIQKEVEIFSLQMMHCCTTFTAFGFYKLNCKQIASCIGVITTYMVILIQVSDSIKTGS
ncbi:hypothetical protein M0802_011055 [Mischocyttarus mexicanus]|nr:hypothetical protein M0802_011055 [Mischocyttarus mexicanus]